MIYQANKSLTVTGVTSSETVNMIIWHVIFIVVWYIIILEVFLRDLLVMLLLSKPS